MTRALALPIASNAASLIAGIVAGVALGASLWNQPPRIVAKTCRDDYAYNDGVREATETMALRNLSNELDGRRETFGQLGAYARRTLLRLTP